MRAHATLVNRFGIALALACTIGSLASAQERGRARGSSRRPQATQAPNMPSEPNASDAQAAPTPGAESAGVGSGAASGTASNAGASGADAQAAAAASAAPTHETEVAPSSAATEPAAPDAAELASAREQLSSVMDALVSARTRVGLLGKSLFKTRVRVVLENEAAGDQELGKVVLWLDGALIYRGEGSALRGDVSELFQGFAAPGPHVLMVEVEQRAREDDAYRYSMRNGFRFVVLREHVTALKIVLDDDSDVAEDFADDHEGEYDVQMRLEIEARPLGGS